MSVNISVSICGMSVGSLCLSVGLSVIICELSVGFV